MTKKTASSKTKAKTKTKTAIKQAKKATDTTTDITKTKAAETKSTQEQNIVSQADKKITSAPVKEKNMTQTETTTSKETESTDTKTDTTEKKEDIKIIRTKAKETAQENKKIGHKVNKPVLEPVFIVSK